jgi:amino acid transporter
VNAATRVFYALARNGLAPRPLGHVHPRYKTPSTAIIYMSVFAFGLSLLLGWKWGPLIGFSLIATLAVIVVIVVYMLICLGAIWEYWVKRRAEFNPILHFVMPIGGIVLFFFPLYYQYYKFVPTYPIKYANWIAIGWIVAGVVLTIWLSIARPERLRAMERVYVDDETLAPADAAATFPVA